MQMDVVCSLRDPGNAKFMLSTDIEFYTRDMNG